MATWRGGTASVAEDASKSVNGRRNTTAAAASAARGSAALGNTILLIVTAFVALLSLLALMLIYLPSASLSDAQSLPFIPTWARRTAAMHAPSSSIHSSHAAPDDTNTPAHHERYAAQLYTGMVRPQRPLVAVNPTDPDAFTLPEHVAMPAAPPGTSYPRALEGAADTPREVLRSRLVVAIGCGVHSGKIGKDFAATERSEMPIDAVLDGLPLLTILAPTWTRILQPHHVYRFYFAFDDVDPLYSLSQVRTAITKRIMAALAAENARRWHPAPGGGPVDDTALMLSVHWVACAYTGKPSWAHNDAIVAAYADGADYALRVNDDSRAPAAPDAIDRFIMNLRARSSIRNLGVAGPMCEQGAPWILTHDFTHRTHVAVFGYYYPRSLPDWSSDDWITYAYEQFDLAHKLPDVTLVHETRALGRSRGAQAQWG